MNKRNYFSNKFDDKTSSELRNIVSSSGYQKDAKLAAVWELERRGEATEEDQKLASGIEKKNELEEATRLQSQRYRTFWRRFIAAIIDGVVMWPIGSLLSYLTSSDIGIIVIIGNLLNSLSLYIYSVLFHGYFGQTPGKMAMEVKVVDVGSEDVIDLKQAFIRDSVPIALVIGSYVYSLIVLGENENLDIIADLATLTPMFIIGLLTILWPLLEIFSMLFSEKSRAVHDLIAKTVVVRTG